MKALAVHYFGDRARWAYEAFDELNADLFGGELPVPWIHWGITAHGAYLGLTTAPAVVTLHPSLLGGTERRNPWGIPAEWLGYKFARDTLIHELIHVRLAGTWKGPSSHNNPQWVGEGNRLAPLLGLPAGAGRSRVRRVEGKSRRVTDGAVPFRAVARFPRGVRKALGTTHEFYTSP